MDSFELRSKNIVLTGGTSGIGHELVRMLRADNRVSVIGRPSSRLDALDEAFPDVRIYEADLADQQQVAAAADLIVKRDEAVDVLINNAAVQHTPHFLDDGFCVETIGREIDVNLTAPAILTYLMLPVLLQSETPLILNINSGLGLVPKSSSAVYCASKGGLNTLSQALQNQFASTKIQVSQAFLPLVDTGMTAERGSGKISASEAAVRILQGVKSGRREINVGKVKILRLLVRVWPSLARSIMQRA